MTDKTDLKYRNLLRIERYVMAQKSKEEEAQFEKDVLEKDPAFITQLRYYTDIGEAVKVCILIGEALGYTFVLASGYMTWQDEDCDEVVEKYGDGYYSAESICRCLIALLDYHENLPVSSGTVWECRIKWKDSGDEHDYLISLNDPPPAPYTDEDIFFTVDVDTFNPDDHDFVILESTRIID